MKLKAGDGIGFFFFTDFSNGSHSLSKGKGLS